MRAPGLDTITIRVTGKTGSKTALYANQGLPATTTIIKVNDATQETEETDIYVYTHREGKKWKIKKIKGERERKIERK